MLAYTFGPNHPLRPERLKRTIQWLEELGVGPISDPGFGEVRDVLRVHDPRYVEAVQALSAGGSADRSAFGFGPGDNPAFSGMFEAAMAYVAGSAAAARAVCDGERLAFGLAGGLHHARFDRATGFCIFNDCAVALSLLRERFSRVAYVDIDVHHGCGVQWLFYDDPTVMTCSIHQDGRTIYPGSGFVEETGAEGTSINVPLPPGTTGDTWLWAFQKGILPALEWFRPEAIVLQMGTDTHFEDQLGRLKNTAQEWTEAVRLIREFGVPIVALGGGGYNLEVVPRMWVAATLTLMGRETDSLGLWDAHLPEPRNSWLDVAENVVEKLASLTFGK